MTKPLETLRKQSTEVLKKSHRAASEWLLTDVGVSIGFAETALDPLNSPQKRERNRIFARRGYDAVTHFSKRVQMPESGRRQLQANLRKLKSLLKKAGEKFPT